MIAIAFLLVRMDGDAGDGLVCQTADQKAVGISSMEAISISKTGIPALPVSPHKSEVKLLARHGMQFKFGWLRHLLLVARFRSGA